MKTETPDIKVVAPNGHHGNDWRMAVGSGTAQGPGHYPKVAVHWGNDADLTFGIMNSKVTFAQDNPILIGTGTKKPTAVDGQFSVTGGGTQKLVVHDANTNAKPTDYYYVLQFSDGTTLDPIISNGGCCQPANGLSLSATSLIISVATLAVVLYVAFQQSTLKHTLRRIENWISKQ